MATGLDRQLVLRQQTAPSDAEKVRVLLRPVLVPQLRFLVQDGSESEVEAQRWVSWMSSLSRSNSRTSLRGSVQVCVPQSRDRDLFLSLHLEAPIAAVRNRYLLSLDRGSAPRDWVRRKCRRGIQRAAPLAAFLLPQIESGERAALKFVVALPCHIT
ncbi:MAG: hypothetical protein CSA62_10805 [Planctomycetota bacterium]|nr:MAG: hypothetical protein CSA62_10805 [Planctomycetota bacterium]